MTTITASTTVGIDLNPASITSPVIIDAGVTVSNPGYAYAVYRHPGATTAFVIDNNGTITSGTGIGVYLAPGGAITNAASASINSSNNTAVKIAGGAGTVVNYGQIIGYHAMLLTSGGAVTNATSALLAGGISFSGGAGTLINNGSMHGGAKFTDGGSVTNGQPGILRYGIDIGGAAGTIGNSGKINAGVSPVILRDGGTIINAASATIFSANAVIISNASGTVVNDGSIGSSGVSLLAGGSVTNGASGSITGKGAGVYGTAFLLVSAGRITATTPNSGIGVKVAGGSITNAASASITGATGVSGGIVINDGTITGTSGVAVANAALLTNGLSGELFGGVNTYGTVTNYGSITAAGNGVIVPNGIVTNSGDITANTGVGVSSGGQVTNQASGTIAGRTGVSLSGGGTLTNAGTIIGNLGTAVYFGGSGGRLVLDPGFAFSGLVTGSTSSNSSMELVSAASTGTVTGLGSGFEDFGSLTFDPDARWFVSGLQRGLAGPIYGFAPHETIELTGDTAIGSSFVSGVLTLDLAGGGSATLDLPGHYTSASDFIVTNVAAGADVMIVPCFPAGTRILTATGEVPVEQLRIGNRVATMGGKLARIVWLGHQRAKVPPIRIRAGAFGDHSPARDVLLSPDHAVFVGAALVPVRHLVNGDTIVQEPAPEVLYYHIELASHNVILAEGLPCETYLDTGNRAAFSGALYSGTPIALKNV